MVGYIFRNYLRLMIVVYEQRYIHIIMVGFMGTVTRMYKMVFISIVTHTLLLDFMTLMTRN